MVDETDEDQGQWRKREQGPQRNTVQKQDSLYHGVWNRRKMTWWRGLHWFPSFLSSSELNFQVFPENLALFRTLVRAPDLIKLLKRLRKNLATVTFYHVSLAQDDNWTSILKELSRDFTALTSISLYYLWTSAPTKEVLSFPDLQKAPMICESPGQRLHMLYAENPIKSHSVLGVEYSGPKVPQVLSLLQTAAVYMWIAPTVWIYCDTCLLYCTLAFLLNLWQCLHVLLK